MTQLLAALSHSTGIGLIVVGAAALITWLRQRDRMHAWLALALGLLGATALAGELSALGLQNSTLIGDLTLLTFLGSGWALLGLRDTFVPLSASARKLAIIGLATASLAGLVAASIPGLTPTSPARIAVGWVLILMWAACVTEPTLRFLIASRGRPRAQRARLRLLSVGYLSIVGVLMVALLASALHSVAIAIGFQVVVLLAIPQLYFSFSPPAWLRAVWRARDERVLQQATDELLRYCPDLGTLAERAVEWSVQLAGAEAGAFLGPDGVVLAGKGPLGGAPLARPRSGIQLTPSMQRVPGGRLQHITLPLSLSNGHGALILVVGPLCALFGADELARLEQYAASVTLACTRVQLQEELERRTALHEAVLQAIDDMGEGLLVRSDTEVVYSNVAYSAITGNLSAVDLGTNARREQELVTGTGDRAHLETAVRRVTSLGATLTVAMIRDITERKRYERAMAEQAQLLDLAHDAIFVRGWQPLPVITYWSRGAEATYGWTATEAVGHPSHELLRTVFPLALEEIEALVMRDGQWEGELIQHHRDGSSMVIASHWALRANHDGVADGILEVNRDITEQRHGERIKAAQLGVNRALISGGTIRDAAPLALAAIGAAMEWDVAELWLTDAAGEHLRMVETWMSPGCSAAAFRAAGSRLGLRKGRGLAGRVWECARPLHIADIAGDGNCDRSAVAAVAGLRSALALPLMVDQRAIGAITLYAQTARPADDGVIQPLADLARYVGGFVERRRTASALEESVERLQQLVATDALTGLSNRRAFEATLAGLDGSAFSVLAIDVDNLKPVNDEYGHEAGDVMLQMVARTLRSLVRDADLVARVGGDEFAVLLPGTGEIEVAEIAERMRKAMHAISVPFASARISVGWSTTAPGANPREVWRAADESLYRAKEAGRDRVEGENFATGEHRGQANSDDAALLTEVLSDERIGVVFQPIVDLRTGAITGYEALARPRGHGPMSSVEHVFRAARRLGRIRDLDWLSRRAAVHAAQQLPGRPTLFLNVSAVAFLDPVHPVDQLLLLLQSVGWSPENVVLEITEQEAVRDLAQLRLVVASHREHGIRFAIDDVGEGHSTLELLAATNPEFIKIAGSLTSGLADAGSTSAVQAALAFARSSRAQVIAEGIETEAVLQQLRTLRVPLGQGYHLGKPMAAEAIAAGERAQAS